MALRPVMLIVAIGACSFSPVPHGPVDAAPDDARPDAPDAPDGAVPAGACMTPNASGLVACFEVEDDLADGTLADSSTHGHDAATTGLSPTTRGASRAAIVTPTATTYVPVAPELDLAAGYTYAVWIRPNTVSLQGVLDHELQYALVLRPGAGGELAAHCTHTGVARTEYVEHVPLATWSLIACTWDGTTFSAYRWTGAASHEHFSHRPTLRPATVGAHGLAIGHLSNNGSPVARLDGAFDSLQLYDRAFTADQVCALAGQPAGCLPCDTCEE